jgi:hypothetical protein
MYYKTGHFYLLLTIDSFKKSFLQGQNLSFSNFFPTETIETIIAHTPHKRTSVFSPLVTLQAFIFQDRAGLRHGVFQHAKFGSLLGTENTQHRDPAMRRQGQITNQSDGGTRMFRTIICQ